MPAAPTTMPRRRPADGRGGHRVGIDLVAVDAVQDAVATWGPRYLRRVYTAAELTACTREGVLAPERLAARFAVKEAVIKVLRPGRGDAVPWTGIEVGRHPGGVPEVLLHGRAAALAARERVGELAVSLAHEHRYATAVVLATIDPVNEGAS